MRPKEYTRFNKDRRVVIVDNTGDIPTLSKKGVHGVLCPYTPFTSEEHDEIIAYMQDRLDRGLGSLLIRDRGPESLFRAMDQLEDIFRQVTGAKNVTSLVRVNKTTPHKPHRHIPTLTYTFSGAGTIGVNRLWQRYSTPDDHLFIFDHKIRHMASQILPANAPKITILVS